MATPDGQNRIFRFGVFEIDTGAGELRRSGMRQKLAPQPFQVLQALLERPGELVTRSELEKRLWPDGVATDYDLALKKCVNRIRLVLADSADFPRFIETVPRRGYRFIAPVERVGAHHVRFAAVGANPSGPAPPSAIEIHPPAETPAQTIQVPRRKLYWTLAAILSAAVIGGLWLSTRVDRPAPPSEWVQLTDFPDFATSPALSPDGRMLAFIHGPTSWASPGQIYLKMLSAGPPVQLTHDSTLKYAPAFSSDGLRVAYSVLPGWDTWVVPVLGGEPHLMLSNASGLSWLDERHVLFSEIKRGVHMGIVTAVENRTGARDVYLSRDTQGMAHRSRVSPDHKWMLVVEMDERGWMPCRLVPFDGTSEGKPVGPPGSDCTDAGWSRDGKWMFFSSSAGGSFHLWRQRFPGGKAEQITFGPTVQEGIEVSPDGRSLLTSVGLVSSTLWVHDGRGERQIAFEGLASLPSPQTAYRALFSPDGTRLIFMGRIRPRQPVELWMAHLDTGHTIRLFPGIPLNDDRAGFDLSPDGKEIVMDSTDSNGHSQIWVAPLDHRSSPRPIGSEGLHPVFGPAGDVFFQVPDGNNTFLYRQAPGETGSHKALANPIARFETISPDGNWAVAEASFPGPDAKRSVVGFPLAGGDPRRVCRELCTVRWTTDGNFLTIGLPKGSRTTGRYISLIIPLPSGEDFPPLPPDGIASADDLAAVPGVKVVDELILPGPTGSIYAESRWTVHRNIYQIPLP
jgi:DNA-binding winged helix-turn-helix (wHTH) protein/Tol biopolymer transport system component